MVKNIEEAQKSTKAQLIKWKILSYKHKQVKETHTPNSTLSSKHKLHPCIVTPPHNPTPPIINNINPSSEGKRKCRNYAYIYSSSGPVRW
jgi:hypothetical protein